MTPLRLLTSAASFACLSLLATASSAKPEYPHEMTAHLSLSYTPPCSVCHIDGVTGAETVVTPFGYAMLAHGLGGGSKGVGSALDEEKSSGVDSDGDGVTDIDELVAGTDPNSTANGALSGPASTAGCAIGGLRADPAALLSALGLGLLLIVGRRRARA